MPRSAARQAVCHRFEWWERFTEEGAAVVQTANATGRNGKKIGATV